MLGGPRASVMMTSAIELTHGEEILGGRSDACGRILEASNIHRPTFLDRAELKRAVQRCWRQQACFSSLKQKAGLQNFLLVSQAVFQGVGSAPFGAAGASSSASPSTISPAAKIDVEHVTSVARLQIKKPLFVLVPRLPRWILVMWDGDLATVKNTQYIAGLVRDEILASLGNQPVEERLIGSLEGLAAVICGEDEAKEPVEAAVGRGQGARGGGGRTRQRSPRRWRYTQGGAYTSPQVVVSTSQGGAYAWMR